MLIAVDAGGVAINEIKVWIYTSAPARVVEFTRSRLEARDSENVLGVLWDGRDRYNNRVPSGVYIYELSVNGGPPVLGKFAVIRE
jgi:hypothetical protein